MILNSLTVKDIAVAAFQAQSDPNHIYVVVTQNSRSGEDGTAIYVGGNYEKAVDVANFWDERVNTWLIIVNEFVIEEVELNRRTVNILRSTVAALAEADLEASKLEGVEANFFANLTAAVKLDIYVQAAQSRIS